MPLPGVLASGYNAPAGGGLVAALAASGAQGFDTGTDTGFVSSSFSPGANCALVLLIGCQAGTADPLGAAHTVVSSGSGPTWSKLIAPSSLSNKATTGIWTATLTGDPGAFTVTADWAGAIVTGMYAFSIHKFTGHNTGTPFGGKLANTNQTGDGALSPTLDAAPTVNDITVALAIADVGSVGGASTFGAGTWTNTGGGSAAPDVSWNTGYRTGSTSTSVPWTDVNGGDGSFSSAQCALVVKAA